MKKSEELLLTIVTPTFNRATELKDLYNSLLSQTNKEFQWLIIDDGSSDHTHDLILKFKEEKTITINYLYQENKGKHVALNKAFDNIQTELLIIVDSDDTLIADAVEIITNDWKEYRDKGKYCGITYLRGYDESTVLGQEFIADVFTGNYIDDRINARIMCDKAEVWQTSIFKNNKFPEFENEKFLGEAMLWIKATKDCDILFKNEIIYIGDYLEGGLTNKGRSFRTSNPMGGMAHANEFVNTPVLVPIQIKNSILYGTYGFFSNLNIKKVLKNSNNQLLTMITFPVSYLLYLYWKVRH